VSCSQRSMEASVGITRLPVRWLVKPFDMDFTGGLTGHPWRSDREHLFWPPKIYFFRQDFSRISTDSNLETNQKSLRTKEKNGGTHSEFLDNILIRIMNLSKVATID
jgi:hypothetical protein